MKEPAAVDGDVRFGRKPLNSVISQGKASMLIPAGKLPKASWRSILNSDS